MNVGQLKAAIEAILFASGYTVKYDILAKTLEIGSDQVKMITRQLADEYDGRGIMLLLMEDCCQLCTRSEYGEYIRTALGIRGSGGLSQSVLETLAIVAYNQPVTRAFVEQVRGVDSSYAISALGERGLIECCGKLDVPGKPNLYVTTSDFLRCFGLSSVSELPEMTAGALLDSDIGAMPQANG